MYMNYKKISIPCAGILILLFFGCTSTGRRTGHNFLPNGIYAFNYECIIDCTESRELYKASGIDVRQDITKKTYGYAVFLQNGRFIDPETKMHMRILKDGNIRAAQNESIHGICDKTGALFFQGFYEENNQIFHITVKGHLNYSDPAERAGAEYNGIFTATDSGTGRTQHITVKDGLYFWRYAEKRDGDSENRPLIVHKDGTVDSGLTFISRTVMTDVSEMIFNTVNQTNAQISPAGSIAVKYMTLTSGTGMSEGRSVFTYSGKRFSDEKKIAAGDDIYVLLKAAPDTEFKQPQNAPAWYTDTPGGPNGCMSAAAKKTHPDKTVALRIAESCAAAELMTAISMAVQTYTEAKQTGKNVYLYEFTDSAAVRGIPYTVQNSFYDEQTHTGFVRVELSKREADEIIRRATKKAGE